MVFFPFKILLLLAFVVLAKSQEQQLQWGGGMDAEDGGDSIVQVPIIQTPSSSISSTLGIYKVDQCMLSIQPQVCDPDGVLSSSDVARIERELGQLERDTQTSGMSSLRTFRGECPSTGLSLKILLFKNLADPENTDQKILNLHWSWTMAHPCARTAVIMLSPGPDYRSIYGEWSPDDYYARYPAGVWSKFYAVSSPNAGISSSELLSLYYNSIYSVRRGEIVQALENIINQIRNKIRG